MAKKLTVLHITPFFHPNVGGVETHLTDLTRGVKDKIKVYVLTYQALIGKIKGKTYQKDGNLQIFRIPWISGVFYKTERRPLIHFLYLTPYLALRSILFLKSKNDVDIIHAHGINAAYCAWIANKLFSIPYIVSMHVEFNFNERNFLTRFLTLPLMRAEKILVLTKRSAGRLSDIGISKRKITAYSYWVNQRVFAPIDKSKCRKKLTIDKESFVVLFVGRLSEQKGVRMLMEIAKKLGDVEFLFAGTGELDDELKIFANKYKNISFLGKVENNKLPFYYNSADVVAVLSRVVKPRPVFEEGVPRVIIESISCGVPVIGTDSGGMKEVVEKGCVGEIVDWNTKSVIKVLSKYKKNRNLLNKLQRNCREFALEKFGERQINVFLKTYQGLGDRQLQYLLRSTADTALRRRANWLVNSMKLEKGDAILDVGCGDGFYLSVLNGLGKNLKLFGTDFDKKALASAKRNLKGKKIKLVWGDLMKKLPFFSNSFDKVIMSEVAEHLPDDVKGLKEVRRVLKDNGTLCLSVPSKKYPFLWDPINWILEHTTGTHIKSGFFAGIWNQHERLYNKEEIEKFVKHAGFNVVNSSYLTWWCLPFNHYIVNIGARILLGKGKNLDIARGASKFRIDEKRSFIPCLYFSVANTIDKLNDKFSVKGRGVSLVLKLSK